MKKHKSAILEAVHQTAQGFHRAGAMDQLTMREFDRMLTVTLSTSLMKMVYLKRKDFLVMIQHTKSFVMR